MVDIVAGYKARLQEIERDWERALRDMEVSEDRCIEDHRTHKVEHLGRLTDHEQVKDASDGTDVNTSSEPVPREVSSIEDWLKKAEAALARAGAFIASMQTVKHPQSHL